MRRGTPAAEEFGRWLKARRENLGLSMRAVGARVSSPAATISQVERGQRALKEPKIPVWAKALEISESRFRSEWNKVQRQHPDGPIVRRRAKTIQEKDLITLMSDLTATERSRVRGYIEAIIEMREQ